MPPTGLAQANQDGPDENTNTGAAFRQLIKWRTGAEGRISHLKHRYGWARSGMDGRERTAIWCGHGVLAHNLVKVTRLAAAA
jgi:IS5 family transposase